MRRFFSLVALTLALLAARGCEPVFAQNPAGAPAPWTALNFLGATGVIVPGGKVCTYAAGTTNPLFTYQDYQLQTQNSNPIVLNSQGRPTTNGIYLAAQQYKFVLRTAGTDATCSTGSVIWTYDHLYDLAQLYQVNFATQVDDQVCHASQWPGSTADVKIAACIAELPGTGGTVDARGLQGAQTWAACPFTGVTISVTVLMGAGQTSTASCTQPDNVILVFPVGGSLNMGGSVIYQMQGGVVAPSVIPATFQGSGTLDVYGFIDAPRTQIFGAGLTVNVEGGQNKYREVYGEWWGMRGDNATDNGPLLATVVASLPATPPMVTLGEGRFQIQTAVTVSLNGFRLEGANKDATILDCHASTGITAITLNGQQQYLSHVSVDNTGSTACAKFSFTDGIDIHYEDIRNTYAKGFTTAMFQCGADSDNALECYYDKLMIAPSSAATSGSLYDAIDIWMAFAPEGNVTNSILQDGTIGIQSGTALSNSHVTVTGTRCGYANNTAGVCHYVKNGGTYATYGGQNQFQYANNLYMKADALDGGIVSGAEIEGTGAMTTAINATSSSVNHLSVIGNTFDDLNGYAVTCSSGADVVLYDNNYLSPTNGGMNPTNACGMVTVTYAGSGGTTNLPQKYLAGPGSGATVFFVAFSDGGNSTVSLNNQPNPPASGQMIQVVVSNTSGGSLGTITWDSNFSVVGGSQAGPAPGNGQQITISFTFNAAAGKFKETGRSGSTPN